MKIRDPRGLSLLELMVATGLVGVVGLSFAFLYSSSQRFLVQSTNYTTSQGEASFALEHIKRRLLQTTTIDNPPAPVAPAVTSPLVLSDANTFQFTWEPSRAEGSTRSQYRLTNKTLEFQRTSGGGWATVARGVEGVTFTRTGRSTVEVTLTSRKNAGGDIDRDTQLQTIVTPRGLL